MGTISTGTRNAFLAALNARAIAGTAVANPLFVVLDASSDILLSVTLSASQVLESGVSGVAEMSPPAGESTWVSYLSTPLLAGVPASGELRNRDSEAVYVFTLDELGFGSPTPTLDPEVDARFEQAPAINQNAIGVAP